MGIPENIKFLREQHKLTQDELGKIAGVSGKAVSTWENGTKGPRMGALQKIADHFHISKSSIIEDDGLMAPLQTRPWQPSITEKDKRDIAKEVDDIIGGLSSSAALCFDADDIDDETRELLRKSLENVMETARLLAKKKYTPYKYRVTNLDA